MPSSAIDLAVQPWRNESWGGPERIMVCVTTASGMDAVICSAFGIATSMGAELHVVHVESYGHARGPEDCLRLDQLHRVVREIGATWHDVGSQDTAQALIDFAKYEGVTEIVLGSSRRSRWQELRGGGSTVARVTRLAGVCGFDVHVIAWRHGLRAA